MNDIIELLELLPLEPCRGAVELGSISAPDIDIGFVADKDFGLALL